MRVSNLTHAAAVRSLFGAAPGSFAAAQQRGPASMRGVVSIPVQDEAETVIERLSAGFDNLLEYVSLPTLVGGFALLLCLVSGLILIFTA